MTKYVHRNRSNQTKGRRGYPYPIWGTREGPFTNLTLPRRTPFTQTATCEHNETKQGQFLGNKEAVEAVYLKYTVSNPHSIFELDWATNLQASGYGQLPPWHPGRSICKTSSDHHFAHQCATCKIPRRSTLARLIPSCQYALKTLYPMRGTFVNKLGWRWQYSRWENVLPQ